MFGDLFTYNCSIYIISWCTYCCAERSEHLLVHLSWTLWPWSHICYDSKLKPAESGAVKPQALSWACWKVPRAELWNHNGRSGPRMESPPRPQKRGADGFREVSRTSGDVTWAQEGSRRPYKRRVQTCLDACLLFEDWPFLPIFEDHLGLRIRFIFLRQAMLTLFH